MSESMVFFQDCNFQPETRLFGADSKPLKGQIFLLW